LNIAGFYLFDKGGVYFPQGIRYEDEYYSRVIQYYASHVQVLKDYLYVYRQWPGSFMNSANAGSAKYLVDVYRQLSSFAERYVSQSDQDWFRYNIVSLLLETHNRFLDQLDSDEFKQFRKQFLPYIQKEFNSHDGSFSWKEKVLGNMLINNPKHYAWIMSRYQLFKRWTHK